MSYENAPATKMLATQCAVCGRPLVDSVSVEIGIGPDCRAKHGYDSGGLDEESRTEANKIVYRIALGVFDPAQLRAECLALATLGFNHLAGVILERRADLFVTDIEGGRIAVKVPFRSEWSPSARNIGGSWNKDAKRWEFSGDQRTRNGVFAAMCYWFPNSLGVGPKGPFLTKPQAQENAAR